MLKLLERSELITMTYSGNADNRELALINKILAGELDLFEKLVERHAKAVFAIVAKRVPVQEIEQVAQDVWLQAYRSLRLFKGEKPFEHWLTRIALRRCCDFWRREDRVRRLISLSSEEDASAWLDRMAGSWSGEREELRQCRQEAIETVNYALSQLKPEDRLVVELVHMESRSTKEIASILDWSESKVKVRTMRARRKLRKIIEKMIN